MAAAVDIFGRLSSSLKPIASVVLSLGVCYAINSVLSRRAVAGKRPSSSWRWNDEGEGKEIVVVTGGSGGIGGALVREFVRRGVTVVSLDIKPPSDDDENDAIGSEKKEKKSHFYQVDLRSRTAIREAATHIRTTIGSPSVLINNAGLASGLPILQASESGIRDIFDVNILSHFWLVQEFLPEMVERDHGHVVSVASVAAYVTLAGNVEYSCAKAGVMAFHEGLGQELRHRYGAKSVLTSIVYPYWVQTRLIKNLTAHPTFHDPLMTPVTVAERIVQHVMRGDRGGEVYLPWYAGLLAGLRGWPLWVQELARDSKAGTLRETAF